MDNVEIFKHRERWCYYDEAGKLHKFSTELKAKESLGFKDPAKDCNDESCDQDPCECEEETKNGEKEKESGKEKASSNK